MTLTSLPRLRHVRDLIHVIGPTFSAHSDTFEILLIRMTFL